MNSREKTLKNIVVILLLLSAIEGIICIKYIYYLPVDLNHLFLIGISFSRLVLLSVLVVVAFSCLIIGLTLTINPKKYQNIAKNISRNFRVYIVLFGFSLVLFTGFALFPSYRFGHYKAYIDRLWPAFVWFALFSFQFFIFLLFFCRNINGGKRRIVPNRIAISSFVFIFITLILWLIVSITKWGVSPIVRFWEKSGVPLLSEQEYWVVAICFVFLLIVPIIYPNRKDIDTIIEKYQWVIFLGIWLISAFLWIREPIQFNHFNPGPYPPNFQHYPNSDAQYYDLSAQRALLGQDQFDIDKPLYSALLLFYHILAGQDANLMINLQCGLFAVFPALMFLLGLKVHKPIAGILAALIANFRVINSIAGQLWIWKTSSPKLMMTEFPTAILIALLILMLWGWFTSKHDRIVFAIASGGVLALATLLRHNNWIFLPTIIFLSIFALWKNRRLWIKSVSTFMLSTFVILIPMIIFSQNHYGVSFIFSRAMRGSVIAQRYNLITESTEISESELEAIPELTNTTGSENYEEDTFSKPSINPDLNSVLQPGRVVSGRSSPSQPVSALGNTNYFLFTPLIDTMVRHFFHNIVSTGLSTPLSFQFHSLEYLLHDSQYVSLWDIEWNAKLPFVSKILLFKNITVFCIALGFCWKKWRWAGMTPLVMMGAYYVGNGIATTSGGRYLIPVDWIFYFYFAIGWVVIFDFIRRWVTNDRIFIETDDKEVPLSTYQTKFLWKINILLVVFFLSIVSLVALGLNGFPQAFPDYTQEEILDYIKSRNDIGQAEIAPYINAVSSGELLVVHGRFLYPQYLSFSDDKDFELDIPLWKENVPALIFTVLSNGNDFINGRIILDSPPESKLPDGVEAIVFTCPNYDAYALLLLENDASIILTKSGLEMIDCK